MWKPLALVFACCALALTPIALADDGQPTPAAPIALPATPACTPAGQVYALSRWRRGPARVDVCPAPAQAIARLQQRFADYRTYRRVATFHAPFGHGPRSPADGRWWAVPWQIVCGESRGDFYVNGDGGYQIIPSTWAAHGGTQYAPTAGDATPLEQHIVAHRARAAGEPWFGWKTDCG